ncbi:MAG: hypothetical protein FWH56_01685 [Betaproteobacteria bacterium]|nr:hypothetical protein [Betaproteobacteria bacterium]
MNIRPFIFSQAFAALSFFSLCVRAGEVSVPQCPQQLPIQQQVQTQAVDGWKIVNNNDPQWLEYIGISFLEYPTVQTGLDIPTTEKLPKGDYITHYETGSATSEEHDYWAICQYMKSAVVLVQKLPKNVVRCAVKYINDVTVPNRVSIKCFDTPRAKK